MVRLTPLDVYGVRTKDEHLAKHASIMRQQRKLPKNTTAQPAVTLESDGGLRFRCVCGEYPLVDPETCIACCFNCGLIYQDLTIPEGDS